MTQQAPRQLLMVYYATPLLKHVVKNKLFGGSVIRFSGYLQLTTYLYECGALLGRAKRDVLPTLGKLLATEGGEQVFIEYLQKKARERLDTYRSLSVGKDPKSFIMLFYATELTKFDINMTHKPDWKRMKKVLNGELPFNRLEQYIIAHGEEGIGFGSAFPDDTEKLYRYSREGIMEADWDEMRHYGMNLPENPNIVSFEEQEDIVLSMTANYVAEYFPNLFEPLGLTEYCD